MYAKNNVEIRKAIQGKEETQPPWEECDHSVPVF